MVVSVVNNNYEVPSRNGVASFRLAAMHIESEKSNS